MFRIPAITSLCDQAKERARQIGRLHGSIRGGEGNYTGCLLEVAHKLLFGGKFSSGDDIYDYDVLMPEDWFYAEHGRRVDCKAKERTVPQMDPEWDASIADHAGKGVTQNCDIYAFGSVYVNRSRQPTWIWFMGLMSKKIYLEGRSQNPQGEEIDSRGRPVKRWKDLEDGAEFRKKGLPYDDNGFTCREDCWNRTYSYLDPYNVDKLPLEAKKKVATVLAQAKRERWEKASMYHMLGIPNAKPVNQL